MSDQQQTRHVPDNAGVRVHPPILLIVAILVGHGLQQAWALELPNGSGWSVAGGALIAVVVVIAIAGSVPHALAAAEELQGEGVSVEVIDPRTLVPLDKQAILDSVEKTGRLIVADPAARVCSAASEILSIVGQEAFWSLQAPMQKVASKQVHVPFSPALEKLVYPTKDDIVSAVRKTLE